jgi:ribonuclease D
MHPLIGDLKEVKDADLEAKIGDLTKKYFMTGNPEIRQQMVLVLNSLKEELARRQQEALAKIMANKNLDKLVKVN